MNAQSIIDQGIQGLKYMSFFGIVVLLFVWGYVRITKRQVDWKTIFKSKWQWICLIGYYGFVLCVTCFSRTNYIGLNLQLFSSYQMAWFGGSFHVWSQLLFNIAMFIPLGILLVLAHRRWHKWYLSLVTLFLASLCIEVIQYVFQLGVFEVDDLFNNTLGGMLGFSVMMMIRYLKAKHLKKMACFGVLPFVAMGIGIACLIQYDQQPYGNLAPGYLKEYDWGDKELTYDGELPQFENKVGVYQMKTISENRLQVLVDDLKDKLKLSGNIETMDNDKEMQLFNDEARLIINKQVGTWYYARFDMPENLSDVPVYKPDMTYGERLNIIDKQAIRVDDQTRNRELWEWKLDGVRSGKQGMVEIAYDDSGKLVSITSDVVSFRFVKQEKIISSQEALSRVKEGKFGTWRNIEGNKIVLKKVELDYDIDTKNYLQPIYRFYVESELDDQEIIIPAFAN